MRFDSAALFVALVIEVLLLAAACALVAAGAAAMLLHAHTVNSTSGNLSIRFAMEVTPGVIGAVVAYTVVLALLVACIPAWRAAHTPLVTALARE